jgi:Mlc titration factor MtfA (ptsG expression regulator)
VTDEMAVTIAGQACLLLLNRPSKVYPALHTILVYPSEFVAQRAEVGPGGVVTPGRQSMLGESWDDGRVVLSWDNVRRGAADWTDGHNVVLHEFAHQLDSESGRANGAPYLGHPDSYREWSEVLSRDYQNLRLHAMYRQQTVMDPYGATNPAEFFAVATETFFEKPYQLAEHHAELYAEFLKYYRVDRANGCRRRHRRRHLKHRRTPPSLAGEQDLLLRVICIFATGRQRRSCKLKKMGIFDPHQWCDASNPL